MIWPPSLKPPNRPKAVLKPTHAALTSTFEIGPYLSQDLSQLAHQVDIVRLRA